MNMMAKQEYEQIGLKNLRKWKMKKLITCNVLMCMYIHSSISFSSYLFYPLLFSILYQTILFLFQIIYAIKIIPFISKQKPYRTSLKITETSLLLWFWGRLHVWLGIEKCNVRANGQYVQSLSFFFSVTVHSVIRLSVC